MQDSERSKEFNNFLPQTAATTFAFSAVFILLQYKVSPQTYRDEKHRFVKVVLCSAPWVLKIRCVQHILVLSQPFFFIACFPPILMRFRQVILKKLLQFSAN